MEEKQKHLGDEAVEKRNKNNGGGEREKSEE